MADNTQGMDEIRQEAEEIFCAALELNELADRLAFLEQACAGDARLRLTVGQMLAEYPEIEKFFGEDGPARVPVIGLSEAIAEVSGSGDRLEPIFSANEEAGQQIGPYKLLERIGEGGGGIVYVAEQMQPVRRKVAFKIIKLKMDTKNAIARFELERQALALMDHPNIVRVLDAGATELGRPYAVMELVQGVKITTYCDQERLTTRQRLGLFIQVCNAIQHAHQKGIIHRDIKPSNILITTHDGQPLPKVIDFGIAKATGGKVLTDNTDLTAFEQLIGTPAYMSPEQAETSGLDVDTRSDIYSLGVLLYELLTGKTPFDHRELLQSGLNAMLRTLNCEEPPQPSTKLDSLDARELTQTALDRQAEPRRLKSFLRGDLDCIVMKALEKDRIRRYQTANALAMDVQRHLDNEPVLARPPSRIYRLQKLVRRNRTTFLAIGAVSLALIAGLGASLWMYVQERNAALREQAALVGERSALREQFRLRSEAEAREKIALAVLLLSRGKPRDADLLLNGIEVPLTGGGSLESAQLFRWTGMWHATQGHWSKAAERYFQLARANQVDKADLTDEATRDLISIGPVLIEAGQLERYYQLRRETLSRFKRTDNPIAVEQLLKFTGIIPMDKATVEALAPLADIAKKSCDHPSWSDWDGYLTAWRICAVSLFEYRRGDFTNAMAWSQRSLACSDFNPPRLAVSHLILAMAYAQLHQPEGAWAEWSLSRELIQNYLPHGLDGAWHDGQGDTASGYWSDWVTAHLLLREATANVEASIRTGQQ